MTSTHEVISAFLDDEPFEPEELAIALSDPAGRTLLIDLIALRRIVQPADAVPAAAVANPVGRRPWRLVAAAAALVLALGGGYLAGAGSAVTASSEAPPPTRVVEAVPFVPDGGIR
jgi:hypothetical protein